MIEILVILAVNAFGFVVVPRWLSKQVKSQYEDNPWGSSDADVIIRAAAKSALAERNGGKG